MSSGRPLNILLSLDEAEEWPKEPYIHGCPKKFKPFGLDPLGSRNNGPGPLMICCRDTYHVWTRTWLRFQTQLDPNFATPYVV
jgi:hypothetical protein